MTINIQMALVRLANELAAAREKLTVFAADVVGDAVEKEIENRQMLAVIVEVAQ